MNKNNKNSSSKKIKDKKPALQKMTYDFNEKKPLSSLKKSIFLLILVLSPLILLVFIEISLRIMDYGYPTNFLLKFKKDGQDYYIDNRKFGYRFFPKSMARTPEPLLCPIKKSTNTYRIIVFGESAALGDPAPEFGFSRMLETILKETRKGLNYEVINVSMTAINSYIISEIAKDCVKLNADAWIVYAGNNEIIGPFSPGTVFGPSSLPRPIIKLLINIRSLRLAQLIDSIINKISPEKIPLKEWGGMEMFLKNQIPFDSPELKRVYEDFKLNLINTVKLGKESGAEVFLSTVIANYRDCAPFSSSHKSITPSELSKWDELFKTGASREKEKDYRRALEFYKKAIAIDDSYAELNFRIAKCIEKTTDDLSSLKEFYQRALDYDTLRFRPDSRIINAIRSVGNQFNDKIVFIDAAKQLYNGYSDKLPGNDLLWEHVHLNFDGNYKLALIFAREIIKHIDRKFGFKSDFTPDLISKETVFKKLGLTDWDKLETAKEMQKRLQLPPFINRYNYQEEMENLEKLVNQWEQSVKTNTVERFVLIHKNSVDESPDDWVLRKKYADILEYAGDYQSALDQWLTITNLIPHCAESYFKIGNLLDQLGKSNEAIDYFELSLKLNPDSVEAMSGLGLCLLNLKKYQEAITVLKKAIGIKPDFAPAYVNLSLAYANIGNIEEAKKQCNLALNIRTNYAPAFINLGKFYASEGNYELSLTNYIKAALVEKSNPIVFYNVANGYSRLGRHSEAIANYLKAIELNPKFGEAILNLAIELSLTGQIDDAFKRFEEAIKIMPQNPDAFFNYGIACARKGDYQKALSSLEKAAILAPGNAQIHFNLGLVYVKIGMRQKAIECFEKVLTIDPNNEGARTQLNRLTNTR